MNSDDNQPSTSKKHTENQTQNIMYPISLNDFVKFTNCEELVVKEMERAGPEVLKKNHKKRHKYYPKLYEKFYLNQASRDKMFKKGFIIKPLPKSLRDKLMKMPGDQSADKQKSPDKPPMELNNNKSQPVSIKKKQQLVTEKTKTSTKRTSTNGKTTVKPLVDEIQKITNFFLAMKEPMKPNFTPTSIRKRKSEPPFENIQPQDKRLKVSNPKDTNIIQKKSENISENKKKPTRKEPTSNNISTNSCDGSPTNVQIMVDVAVPIAEDSNARLSAREVKENLKTKAKPRVSTSPELKKNRSEVSNNRRRIICPIDTASDDSDIRSLSQKADYPDSPDSDVCFVPCTPTSPVKSPLPKINRQENYKAHSPRQNKVIGGVQRLEEHQESPSDGEVGLRVSEISGPCEFLKEGLSRKEIHEWIEKGRKEFNPNEEEDCVDDSFESKDDDGNVKVPRLQAIKNYSKNFERYAKYMIGLDKQKRMAGCYQPTIAEGSKRSEVVAAILNMTFEEYKLLLNIDKGTESSELKLQYESIVSKKAPWPRKVHIKFTVLREFLKTKGIRLPLKLIDIPPMLLDFEDVLQHTNLKECITLSLEKLEESYNLLEECRKRYRRFCKECIWMEDMQFIHNEDQSEAQESEVVLLDSQPTFMPPLRVMSSDLRSTQKSFISVSFDQTCNVAVAVEDCPPAANHFDSICHDELECELERIFSDDCPVNTNDDNDNQRTHLPLSTTEEVNPPSEEVACISIDNSPDSVEDLLNNIIQPTPMENPPAQSQLMAQCIPASPNLFPSSGESEPAARDSQQIQNDDLTPEAVYISCNRSMNINTEENNMTALSLDATSDNQDPFADMTVACHEVVVTTHEHSLDPDVVVKQEHLTERINTSFCDDDSVQIIDIPPSEAIVIDDEETTPELLDILLNTNPKGTRITACASINITHLPSSISLDNFPQAQQFESNFSITQSGIDLTPNQAQDVSSKVNEDENNEVDDIPSMCTTQEFIQFLKEDNNESLEYKKGNPTPPTGSLEDVSYVHIAPQSIPSNIELTQSGSNKSNQAVNLKKSAAGETVVSKSVETQESCVSVYVYQSSERTNNDDVMSDGGDKAETPGNLIGVYSIGGLDDGNGQDVGICVTIEDNSGSVEPIDASEEDDMKASEVTNVEKGAIEPIEITEKATLEKTLEGLLKNPEEDELLEDDIDNAVQRFRMSSTAQILAENRDEVVLGNDLENANIHNAIGENNASIECVVEPEEVEKSGKGACEVRHNAVVTVEKINQKVLEVQSEVSRGNQHSNNLDVVSQDVNEISPGRSYSSVRLKRVRLTEVAENFRNDVENIDLSIKECGLLSNRSLGEGDIQPQVVEESTEINTASDNPNEVVASEVTQHRETKIVHEMEGEDILLKLDPEKQSTRVDVLAEAEATKDLSRVVAPKGTHIHRKEKEDEISEGDIQPNVVLKNDSQGVQVYTEDPKDLSGVGQHQYLKSSKKIHEATMPGVSQCQMQKFPSSTDPTKYHQSIEVSEEANKESPSAETCKPPVAQENKQTEGSIQASTNDEITNQCKGTQTAAQSVQSIEDAKTADKRGKPIETLIEPLIDADHTVSRALITHNENVAASISDGKVLPPSVSDIQELQIQPFSVSKAQALEDKLEANTVSVIGTGKSNETAKEGCRSAELATKDTLSAITEEKLETGEHGDMVSPMVVEHSCEFVELPEIILKSVEGNEIQEALILESDLRQNVVCVGLSGCTMERSLLEINDKRQDQQGSTHNPKNLTALAEEDTNDDERADNVLTTIENNTDGAFRQNQMSCVSKSIETFKDTRKIAAVNVEYPQSIEISTEKPNICYENRGKTVAKHFKQTSPDVENSKVTQPLDEEMSKELKVNRLIEAIAVTSKLLYRNNQQLELPNSSDRKAETPSIEDVAQMDLDSSQLKQSGKTSHSKENVPQIPEKHSAENTLKSFSKTANQDHTPQPPPIDLVTTNERPTTSKTFIFPAQLPNPVTVNVMEDDELVQVPFFINRRLWNSLPFERILTTTGIKIEFEIQMSEPTELSGSKTAADLEKQLVDEASDQMISKMHIPGLSDQNLGDHLAELSNASIVLADQNKCFYNADLQSILKDMDVRDTNVCDLSTNVTDCPVFGRQFDNLLRVSTREQLNEDATSTFQNCLTTELREPTDDLELQTETNLIVVDDTPTIGVYPSREESGVLKKGADCDRVTMRCSEKLNLETLVNELFIDTQTTSTSISVTNLTQVQPLECELKPMKSTLHSQNKKGAYLDDLKKASHRTSTTTDGSPASGTHVITKQPSEAYKSDMERQSNVTLRKKPKDTHSDITEKMHGFGSDLSRVQPSVSKRSPGEPKSIVNEIKKITSSTLELKEHSDASQITLPTTNDAPNSITVRKRKSPNTNLKTPQKTTTSPTKPHSPIAKIKTLQAVPSKKKPPNTTTTVNEQVSSQTRSKPLPQRKPGPKSKQKTQPPPKHSKKPLTPDFVPQLTHAFQALPIVTGGKKPPSESGLPDMPQLTIEENIDYRIDDASILPSSSTASQILGTDCTYFENSQLLRNIDEHCAAIVTRKKESPKSREKSKVKPFHQPSLPSSITTLSDGIMARKVWKVHLQWKSPQKMLIETRYITNGRWLSSYDDSAKLLFNFSPATWRNVHTVLKEIDQFEYRRMAVKEKKHTKVVTPLHRVLRGLFDSAPQVINARLIDDTHSPYTRCERATPVYRKPFQCLTKGIPVGILNRMKALKEDLGNNNGNE